MLVRARADAQHRRLYESRWIEPTLPFREYDDVFGNPCWRLSLPPGSSSVRYDAIVEVSGDPDLVIPDAPLVPVDDLPDDVLQFTLPSRYVPSDLLLDDAWRLFGNTPPTWARMQAICDWIHTNIEARTGSSRPSTTALDIYQQRAGVCRDFALMGVAMCRAMNIPARYTFGYLPDIAIEPPDIPMDFHAWFEAYLGGAWHTFDARHNIPRIGRVKVGHGRDVADVALVTAYGSANLASMIVWADEIADTEDVPPLPPSSGWAATDPAPSALGEVKGDEAAGDVLSSRSAGAEPVSAETSRMSPGVSTDRESADHHGRGADAPTASAVI